MIINKKRIKSLSAYTKGIPQNQALIIAVSISDIVKNSPQDMGFSPDLTPGERVLPKAVNGH